MLGGGRRPDTRLVLAAHAGGRSPRSRPPEAPGVNGRVLDRNYDFVRTLGEGGMGAVYEGVQAGTNKRVAIKIIKAEWANRPEMVKRFYREAQATAALDTPHVVQVHDMGQ